MKSNSKFYVLIDFAILSIMCMIPVHFTTVLRVNLHHLILVLFSLFFLFFKKGSSKSKPKGKPKSSVPIIVFARYPPALDSGPQCH